MYRSYLPSVPSAVAGGSELRFSDIESPGGRCELRTLCMPVVAEDSGLLASDIGPRRRPIFCLHALFAVAGELMLGTIRHCGRSRILAAHFTFVPRPIRPGTRAPLLYIRGQGFWIFYCCFVPELSLSLPRCRPCEPCGAPWVYPHPGVERKFSRRRLISYTSPPGRIFTILPCAFNVLIG